MANKFHSDTQEKIETITYFPGFPDSGDLEAGTKTITATAEAGGAGNADYSTTKTLPAPPDARLEVLRIAARLQVTIDSKTAGTLYSRVYVDAQDAGHRLFDLSWTTTGAKIEVEAVHAANKATIFNLLKDGAAHTFYFFFWVNSGNAVLSLVQLQEGVGGTDSSPVTCLRVMHTGTAFLGMRVNVVGSGTPRLVWKQTNNCSICADWIVSCQGHASVGTATTVVNGYAYLEAYGTVSTDLNIATEIVTILRSEA
jgi:hypothetical protein